MPTFIDFSFIQLFQFNYLICLIAKLEIVMKIANFVKLKIIFVYIRTFVNDNKFAQK